MTPVIIPLPISESTAGVIRVARPKGRVDVAVNHNDGRASFGRNNGTEVLHVSHSRETATCGSPPPTVTTNYDENTRYRGKTRARGYVRRRRRMSLVHYWLISKVYLSSGDVGNEAGNLSD